MSGGFKTIIRTYPVTLWLATGIVAYGWNASLVATQYQNQFQEFERARSTELNNVK